jgi:hypothetical protein
VFFGVVFEIAVRSKVTLEKFGEEKVVFNLLFDHAAPVSWIPPLCFVIATWSFLNTHHWTTN